MRLFVNRIREDSFFRTYGGTPVGPVRVLVEAENGDEDLTFRGLSSEWAVGDAVEVTFAKAAS